MYKSVLKFFVLVWWLPSLQATQHDEASVPLLTEAERSRYAQSPTTWLAKKMLPAKVAVLRIGAAHLGAAVQGYMNELPQDELLQFLLVVHNPQKAVHDYATTGHLQILEWLEKANVDFCQNQYYFVDWFDKFFPYDYPAIAKAIACNQLEAVKKLVVQGAFREREVRCLLWASRQTIHEQIFDFILSQMNGTQLNPKECYETPLTSVAWSPERTQKLLDLNADVNGRTIFDETPLVAAVFGGHVDTVKILFANKADTSIASKRFERTGIALDIAVRAGHTDIVELLQEHDKN